MHLKELVAADYVKNRKDGSTGDSALHNRPQTRQLAFFLALSILLHAALLFAIRPAASHLPIPRQHPVTVYLAAPPIPEHTRVHDKTRIAKPGKAARLMTTPDMTPPPATPRIFSPQQLMESAKSIARDEAIKTEQGIAAMEKKRLDTPAGQLAQYMRMPHKEIHLANGVTKIVTDEGSVCFQPVPYFARDMAGLFGIPTSCP